MRETLSIRWQECQEWMKGCLKRERRPASQSSWRRGVPLLPTREGLPLKRDSLQLPAGLETQLEEPFQTATDTVIMKETIKQPMNQLQ